MDLNAVLLIVFLHVLYYTYFQIIDEFIRKGSRTKCNHIEFVRLRSRYNVKIKTFQKNSKLYGFSGFRSVYLNENLLRTKTPGKSDAYYALKWTFFHEKYHLDNNHKLILLAMRYVLSCVPFTLLFLDWYYFLPIHLAAAYLIDLLRRRFEDMANRSADAMMDIKELFGERND